MVQIQPSRHESVTHKCQMPLFGQFKPMMYRIMYNHIGHFTKINPNQHTLPPKIENKTAIIQKNDYFCTIMGESYKSNGYPATPTKTSPSTAWSLREYAAF